MRYGIPYKGSKNKIAEYVIENIPAACNFYDLFAGGCAITHAALLSGKYENFFANDIGGAPGLFLDAISGKYKNENRWISREDFFRLKDKEPYIKYCWSFGNNGNSYLYSKEVEPWKKALHFARVFNDFSLFKTFGIDIKSADYKTIIENEEEFKKKYIQWYVKKHFKKNIDYEEMCRNLENKIKENTEILRNYLIDGLKKSGKTAAQVDRFLGNQMSGHYFGKSQWAFPTREEYTKLQSFLYLPLDYEKIYGLQNLYESLQRLQSLQSLQSLKSLQRLQSLETTKSDYRKIEIKKDSVIYCDIPYFQTDGYETEFDHNSFYEWCRKQTELVIISEYQMPEKLFKRVSFIEKYQTLSGGTGAKKKEGLFVPVHQIELYNRMMSKTPLPDGQLLFDFAA